MTYFDILCKQFEDLNLENNNDVDFLCNQLENLKLKDSEILQLLRKLLIRFSQKEKCFCPNKFNSLTCIK